MKHTLNANDLSFALQMLASGIVFSIIGYVLAIWLIFWLAALVALVSGASILNAWEA